MFNMRYNNDIFLCMEEIILNKKIAYEFRIKRY